MRLSCVGSWDGDLMFGDLLRFIFVEPVNFLKSLVIDFGDISFNIWDLSVGVAVLFLVAYIIRRILQ